MRKDVVSTYHPTVNFLYFILVIGCTTFVMHPIFCAFLNRHSDVFSVSQTMEGGKIILWMMLSLYRCYPRSDSLLNNLGITLLFVGNLWAGIQKFHVTVAR